VLVPVRILEALVSLGRLGNRSDGAPSIRSIDDCHRLM
jgi:hypothetical protein